LFAGKRILDGAVHFTYNFNIFMDNVEKILLMVRFREAPEQDFFMPAFLGCADER